MRLAPSLPSCFRPDQDQWTQCVLIDSPAPLKRHRSESRQWPARHPIHQHGSELSRQHHSLPWDRPGSANGQVSGPKKPFAERVVFMAKRFRKGLVANPLTLAAVRA
ncbi:hypothetical protein MHYP_G00184880 [Metynnis hypsauchen]